MEKKHIHCPVNAWDCPYYKNNPQECMCFMPDDGFDPIKECDDFACCWDPEDDYWDDDLDDGLEDKYWNDEVDEEYDWDERHIPSPFELNP